MRRSGFRVEGLGFYVFLSDHMRAFTVTDRMCGVLKFRVEGFRVEGFAFLRHHVRAFRVTSRKSDGSGFLGFRVQN